MGRPAAARGGLDPRRGGRPPPGLAGTGGGRRPVAGRRRLLVRTRRAVRRRRTRGRLDGGHGGDLGSRRVAGARAAPARRGRDRAGARGAGTGRRRCGPGRARRHRAPRRAATGRPRLRTRCCRHRHSAGCRRAGARRPGGRAAGGLRRGRGGGCPCPARCRWGVRTGDLRRPVLAGHRGRLGGVRAVPTDRWRPGCRGRLVGGPVHRRADRCRTRRRRPDRATGRAACVGPGRSQSAVAPARARRSRGGGTRRGAGRRQGDRHPRGRWRGRAALPVRAPGRPGRPGHG